MVPSSSRPTCREPADTPLRRVLTSPTRQRGRRRTLFPCWRVGLVRDKRDPERSLLRQLLYLDLADLHDATLVVLLEGEVAFPELVRRVLEVDRRLAVHLDGDVVTLRDDLVGEEVVRLDQL